MELEQQLAKQIFGALREEDEQKLMDVLTIGVALDVLDPEDGNHAYHGITPFLFAAGQGWEAGCRLLAEYGADVHETDNDGANAMHYLAWQSYPNQQHRKIALFLFEHGIAFDKATLPDDAGSRLGETPLMKAANSGSIWIVNLLLQRGAEVNRKDTSGGNALCHAIYNFHLDIVKTLLSFGAELNNVDNGLCSPLQNVIEYLSYEAAVILLDAGADPNLCDSINQNALHVLCRQGTFNLYLGISFSVNDILRPSYDSIIATPTFQIRLANALIKQGVQLDAKDHKGNTPLMLAVNEDMYDMVRLLIEKGADTALCSPAQLEQIELITLPEDQQRNRPHLSHMLSAISAGDKNRVDILIQSGFDINTKTVNGHNALHYAVGYVSDENAKIVDALLVAGIEYDIVSYSRSSLNSAAKWLQRGSTSLMVAAANNNLVAVERLIMTGSDINRRNIDGNTALFYAARAANIEALKLLLQHGADANTKCMGSYTPLRVMVLLGSLEGVTALLQSGADPNLLNWQMLSALHAACARANIEKSLLPEGATPLSDDENSEAFELRFQFVKLLASHGADLNVGGRRNTPLSSALRNDFYSLAKVLLQLGADPSLCTVHQQSIIKQLLL